MISDERLEELAINDDLHNFPPTQDELNGMAKELLALRKAFNEPVAYTLIMRNFAGVLSDRLNIMTTFESLDKATHYGKGGRYMRNDIDGSLEWTPDPSLDPVVVPLYRKPTTD